MWVNWKRFSFGALMLASLSLLLFGCGDFSGTPTAQKTISGVAAGSDQLALPNATVTAHAGNENGAVISSPASVQSNNKGVYLLRIPADYVGPVTVVASTASTSKLVQLAKQVFSLNPGVTYRSIIPASTISKPTIPPVMISFATDMVVKFMVAANGNSTAASTYADDNIQKATLVLAQFFGLNFAQTPPLTSATDGNTSKAQQDLIVSVQAMVTVSADAIVTKLITPDASGGLGTIANQIKSGITAAVASLAAQGTLPIEYTPNPVINTNISNAQYATLDVSSQIADKTPPTAPSNVTAGSLTAKSVKLAWTKSTDNVGVAGYLVYRADSSGLYVSVGSVDASTPAYTDFLVTPATGYSYQIVAFDGANNLSAASNTLAVTTPAASDSNPPSAPASLSLIGTPTDTQIKIKWGQTTKTTADGTVLPAAVYNIYRNSQFVASTSGTTYVDLSLTQSTSYTYYIKAADADSNLSGASPSLTVRTAATSGGAVTPPPIALGLDPAGVLSYNNVPLTWTASLPILTGTYNVYRNSVLVASGIKAKASGVVVYSDNSVSPNTNYAYAVSAVANSIESAQGNVLAETTPTNPASTDTAAPTSPTNLTSKSVTSSSVSLLWTASTKATGDRIVAGYDVYRSDITTGPLVTVTQPSFVDTIGLAADQDYTYYVVSFSTSGVRSSVITVKSGAVDLSALTGLKVHTSPHNTSTTVPPAPTGLAQVSAGSFTWTTSGAAATGYLVYRNGVQIADTPLLTYTDATMSPATTYVYSVVAYNDIGFSASSSNALTVTTPAAVPDTYGISGMITLNGAGLPGVLVSNGTTVVQTDLNGNYFFTGLSKGNYTVTPFLGSYYVFSPIAKSVSINASNVGGLNFTATLTGAMTSSVNYPDGTIIGGINVPAGAVIGGVTYPTGGTLIGGVFYPTGAVLGGVAYPNGVVIGGVSYPSGTVVGGIALPVGVASAGFSYPTATVVGGINYASGIVNGGLVYPVGSATGAIVYPFGVANGSAVYPTGAATGALAYGASVKGTVINPDTTPNVGAYVVLSNATFTTTTYSNLLGYGYYLLNAPVGTYNIKAKFGTYSSALTPVTLTGNAAVTVPLQLR